MNQADPENIPRHVAVIMDGNGRWAKERGQERVYGHVNGVESMRKVIRAAMKWGVKYLTAYAFSTENWGRPREEVDALMELLCRTIADETDELDANGVRIRFIGQTDVLSDVVRESISRSERSTKHNDKLHLIIVERSTKHNDKLHLIIALNYSSRWEIVRMAQRVAAQVRDGDLQVCDIDAEVVSRNLETAGIPDPDLLIRTSGELRLSNFLLWQLSYSELYFTETYWPDFDEAQFDRAIEEYRKRERRYGVLTK